MKINDVELPAIGLGTWHMGENPAKRTDEIAALRSAFTDTEGLRVIDTAEMYGEGLSEELVGQAIQGIAREKLFLISKVYPWNASKDKLSESLDASLARLGVDYLDLYLLHWRGNVPLAETVQALEEAKKAGKIRAWGVSNFDVMDMEELFGVENGSHCAANQVLYNLGSRGIEFDLLPWLGEHEVAAIAYSPIAQGDSLGNRFLENASLCKMAERHGVSVFQVLLAFAIRSGSVLAIPQSGNKSHVLDNLAAEKLVLTQADLAELAQLYPKPKRKMRLEML